MSDDPLQRLVVDDSDLAREIIAEALEPYIRLTRTGDLVLLPTFEALTAEQKAILALLAFRALQLMELRPNEGGRPADLAAATGVPPGTVRPALQRLGQKRLVTKVGPDYVIPKHATRRAIAAVEEVRAA